MADDAFVSTPTWEKLSAELSEQQLIDLLTVVGRYWCVSVVLNATGVQLEKDTRAFSEYLPEGG